MRGRKPILDLGPGPAASNAVVEHRLGGVDDSGLDLRCQQVQHRLVMIVAGPPGGGRQQLADGRIVRFEKLIKPSHKPHRLNGIGLRHLKEQPDSLKRVAGQWPARFGQGTGSLFAAGQTKKGVLKIGSGITEHMTAGRCSASP